LVKTPVALIMAFPFKSNNSPVSDF
jgi:hypothetical protein